MTGFILCKYWGELPGGLRHCGRIERFPVRAPLGALPGLKTQPLLRGSR